MKQQQPIYPIHRKPLHPTRISKRRRANNFLYPVEQAFPHEEKKYPPEKEAERNIGQNISLIAKKQEGSFISNRQDHSLDSFDKMIMGVDEELDIEEENTSNSKENEVNYTQLYQDFEQLIKYSKIYKNDSAEAQMEEESKILKEDFFQPQEEKLKESSSFQSGSVPSNLKLIRQKIEEIKDIRKQKIVNLSNASDQNISMRLLGANLSQIHEQEIQHNTSINRMDPIEEQFIDFVSKNNASKINISKIEKNNMKEEKKVKEFNKNELNNSIKEPEEDEVVAMLENQLGSRRENLIEEESLIEEQSNPSKKQSKKQFFQKENYHQILRELDENQDKKLDNSNINMSTLLNKREEWINNRNDRSGKWKEKELHLISKIKDILFNPYVEFSDQEDSALET